MFFFLINHLSLYAPITSDECHAWIDLYGTSRAARNTEQAKIYKMHSEIRNPRPARSPAYEATALST